MNIDKYIQMNIDKISPNNKYTKFIKNRINLLLNLDLKIFYQILCAYSIYINDSNLLQFLDDNNLIDVNETLNFFIEKTFNLFLLTDKIKFNTFIPIKCGICLNKNNNLKCRLPCDHKFHFKCVAPWIIKNNNCPYCRTNII